MWKSEAVNLKNYNPHDPTTGTVSPLTVPPFSPSSGFPSQPLRPESTQELYADLLGLDSMNIGGQTVSTASPHHTVWDDQHALSPPTNSIISSPPAISLASSPTADSLLINYTPLPPAHTPASMNSSHTAPFLHHPDSLDDSVTSKLLANGTDAVGVSRGAPLTSGSMISESDIDADVDGNEGEEDEEVLEMTADEKEAADEAHFLGRRSIALGELMNRAATVNEIKARQIEYMRRFLTADSVYCSPLTRAIETAFVALEGHPAMETTGLILYRFLFMIMFLLINARIVPCRTLV